MPPTQDPQTTFKPNLTCVLLSARTRYIISFPNGGPCMRKYGIYIYIYSVIKPILVVTCVRAVYFKACEVRPQYHKSKQVMHYYRRFQVWTSFFIFSMLNCQKPKIGSSIQFSNSVYISLRTTLSKSPYLAQIHIYLKKQMTKSWLLTI